MILADTSFFSLVFRRRAPSAESKRAVLVYQELVRRNVTIGLPGFVAQEALAGLRTEAEFRRMLEVLEGFAIFPATQAEHFAAARVFNQCTAKGVAASAIDCLIAAQAISRDVPLAAIDNDFKQIARCSSLRLLAIP